jgi:hypothetical protein
VQQLLYTQYVPCLLVLRCDCSICTSVAVAVATTAVAAAVVGTARLLMRMLHKISSTAVTARLQSYDTTTT